MSPFHVTVRANAGAKHTYHSCGIVVCNVSHPHTIEPTPNINAMKPAALPICDLGGMRPAVIIPLAITPPPPRQAPMKAELMIRPTPIDEMECRRGAPAVLLEVLLPTPQAESNTRIDGKLSNEVRFDGSTRFGKCSSRKSASVCSNLRKAAAVAVGEVQSRALWAAQLC